MISFKRLANRNLLRPAHKPLLTTGDERTAMVNALRNYSSHMIANQATGGNVSNLVAALLAGPGSQQARQRYLQSK